MSYVLNVWADPKPKTVAEAEAIFERLDQQHCAQMPVFLEFARRLTRVYPCLTTPDAPGEHGAWSDGPLDGLTETPVYAVGLSTDLLPRVVPFFLKTAADLDLVVHDVLSGTTYLPDGTILGEGVASADAEAPEDDDRIYDRPEFARVFRAGLKETMNRKGYADFQAFAMFKKDGPLFREKIELACDGVPNCRDPAKLMWSLFPKVEGTLAKSLKASSIPECRLSLDLWVLSEAKGLADHPTGKGGPFRARFPYEIFWRTAGRGREASNVMRTSMIPFFEHAIFPLLEKLTSWEAIEQTADPRSCARPPIVPSVDLLVIAWLAGRQDLPSLADTLKQCTSGYKTGLIENYLAVLEAQPR